MTSQKSELSVSGLTSVPDVRYPVWLKSHGLLSDSDSDAISASYRSLETHSLPKTRRKLQGALSTGASSSLQVPLNDSYQEPEGRNVTRTHPVNRNPTSHPSSINNDHTSVLWKRLVQDKIEVADAFPKYDPSPLRLHGSPRTDDILEVERSWENVAFPLKPPVPVLCEDDAPGPHSGQKPKLIEDFLNDCLRSDSKVSVSTFSGGHHHGPVEALKHMLFNLQTFQQSIGQGTTTEQAKEEKAISNPESLHLEQEAFPVNKSLQKAMHHLSRLKELVGDGGAHHEENHQET
uniref:Lung adenoma susceptibility protein 2 n=1 Tax=Leptobrachium leishanense TaxID=445787 RepID=A0A8C5LVL5_9ANUR